MHWVVFRSSFSLTKLVKLSSSNAELELNVLTFMMGAYSDNKLHNLAKSQDVLRNTDC